MGTFLPSHCLYERAARERGGKGRVPASGDSWGQVGERDPGQQEPRGQGGGLEAGIGIALRAVVCRKKRRNMHRKINQEEHVENKEQE
eukprot:1156221-Pelagomonas_calceolata.AAC.7